ncbi:MAG: glycosyltransferase family 2 protein [Phormidesmis sp.]
MLKTHLYHALFSQDGALPSPVTVCISLYNYQSHIVETLQSVFDQTQELLDLIVVEDCSTDDSFRVAMEWMQQNAARFGTVRLLRHAENSGLSAARNTAIAASATPYIFILDADNLLYPRCVARCIEALIADEEAAAAYPIIEKFGEEQALIGNVVWNPERFKRVNCIDAMSLIRRDALIAVDGYSELNAVGKLGWEDYELWCKFIDRGFYAVSVPEILARYRTHKTSMLNSVSNQEDNIKQLHREMMSLHPWLDLPVSL